MLNLTPESKIALWVGDGVPNPQSKLGSQGSPQAQRGALRTQRHDRKKATRRTTSLFTNTHLISKNPCPQCAMHSQPAAWQPCSQDHPSQRPETFHVTRCSGSRELCSSSNCSHISAERWDQICLQNTDVICKFPNKKREKKVSSPLFLSS